MKQSKDYYTTLISKKAQFSNNSLLLKRNFNVNEDQSEKVLLLPHVVCPEAYVKASQCKTINFILYTNTTLHKTGNSVAPSFLIAYTQKLPWKDFEFYFYFLSSEFVHLSLKMF